MTDDSQNQWSEENSQLYQEIAPIVVPARAEQIASLLTLLPFSSNDAFRAVEVGCGEGILSEVLLTCFPKAIVIALDGSEEMRIQAAKRLNDFGTRAQIEPFDLMSDDWHGHLRNADCVLSSLVIHHLTGEGKKTLFATIHNHLSPRGVFLIADLIHPQRSEASELFAATWDRITETQSLAETGSTDLFEKFKQSEWNYFRYPDDPIDHPSPLFDQLLWLKEAGFAVVDCFWMQAGHAIYGGYKSAASEVSDGLSFEVALRTAKEILMAD